MTVQTRLIRSDSGLRRLRHTRGAHAAAESAVRMTVREQRDGGPSQDHALYNCHCGYAFEAPVLTSVDCPQCGDGQVW